MSDGSFRARLRSFEGRLSGPPTRGQDDVNQAMIRHYAEAVGDENPVYTDEAAARASGFPGVIAPPAMLQAWIMRGYKASMEAATNDEPSPVDELMSLLDSGGFTSVVATDCVQEYRRPILLGDTISVVSTIESVSDEKKTALGDGHFLTTRLDYTDAAGEVVATMMFRILKFRPKAARAADAAARAAHEEDERPPRPAPVLTQDNSFFFDGAARGELLIQRCSSCGTLRHPPRPGCPECRSLEWHTVKASGRGKVFSFVVVHHPQVPSFVYPLAVVLVELAEGTRVTANVTGLAPEDVRIGMDVVADFETDSGGVSLPVFRPAGEAR